VGAARDRRALARARDKLGADAIVPSGAEDGLPERSTEVAGGPVDLVIDPTWGPAAAAAIDTLRPGGRPVQIANASAATNRDGSAQRPAGD